MLGFQLNHVSKGAPDMHLVLLCFAFFVATVASSMSFAWWRHQMETFSALLALCVGNSPVTGEFLSQMPVTRSFDVSFDLRLNKGWVNSREAGDLRRYHAH